MEYTHITEFLNKFLNLFKNEESKREAILLVIAKHLGHPVQPTSIKIKGSIIYIQSSPIVRSEILIHKSVILEELKEQIPDYRFVDIR